MPTSLPWIIAGNAGGGDSIPPGMFDRWFHPNIAIGRLILTCILALSALFSVALCAFARLDWGPEYVFDIPDTNRKRRAWLVLVIILCQSWIARLLILDLPPSAFFLDRINCGMLVLELVLLILAAWLIGKALPAPRPYWAWGIVAVALIGQRAYHFVLPSDFVARVFYLYRSLHPFGGVCPVLLYIFLFIALAGLLFRHIHSLLIFSKLIKPRVPCHRDANSPPLLCFVTVDHVENILRACIRPGGLLYSKLRRNSTWLGLLILAAVTLLVVAWMLFPQGLETFETRAHAIWLTVFALVIVSMMLLEIGWVILMWVNLQNGLLVPLERTTLRACFSRVSGFSWHRLWFSIDLSPAVRFKPLSRAYESMQRIMRDKYCPPEVKAALTEASRKHNEMLALRIPGERAAAFSAYQDSLCESATRVIGTILSEVSRQKAPLATSLDVPADEVEKVLEDSANLTKADSLEAKAEEFVGLIYIYAIQHVLMDIRSHILALTFSYLFLIFALNAYPVAPHHSIMVLPASSTSDSTRSSSPCLVCR